jgi:hypothetical protein
MFTAAAALISAVTGLIIAIQQLWPEHSSKATAVSTSRPGGAVTADTVMSPPSTTPASKFTVRFPAGMHAEVGEAAYDVVGSGVTVSNPGQLTLALRVRMTNKGRYPANFWSRSFRLRVGSDTGAPSNLLDDVVEGGTTDTGEVEFGIADSTRTATLLVGDDVAKAVALPVRISR